MNVWAVLPVKDLAAVKTRLAPYLSPEERTHLFRCMVEDVIAAVTSTRSLAGLLVVTRDPDVVTLAATHGAQVLVEPSNDGHSVAASRGARWLTESGHHTLMQIPGDIPTVTVAELTRVVERHRGFSEGRDALTIVPSRDYDGSNCVVCTPPDLMPFLFGKDSFRRHIASAEGRGIAVQTLEEPGIALDIDEPGDLAVLAAMAGSTNVQRFLKSSGIGERVLEMTWRSSATVDVS